MGRLENRQLVLFSTVANIAKNVNAVADSGLKKSFLKLNKNNFKHSKN
jgi:hypothetical protein